MFLLCLVSETLANCPNGDHNWDGELRVECPSGKALYLVRSHHSDHYEDRCWHWSCRRVAVSFQIGIWTGYANNHDGPLLFQCAPNLVLCGVRSIHSDKTEDRRWQFKCCGSHGYCTKSCSLSPYLNSFDGPLKYTASLGNAIVGAFSFHSNHAE